VGARAWESTDVETLGDGAYRARIGPEWVLAMVPQGGLLAAIGARAMAAELETELPLRAIHGVFASPVPHGPVEAGVRVLRRGRSVSQASVDVTAPGAASGYSAVAVFGGDRQGFAFTELAMPDVPAPQDCPSFRDPPPPESGWEPHPPWPFWDTVLDGRAAIGHPPWDDSPRGAAEVANWFAFDDPPVLADGMLDPLALLVMADVMPGSVFEKLGPREQGWFAPSIDLSVHLFGHATPGWILAHSKAHHAGDGYASAEMALWDPRAEGGPRLVAWASQQMFFTKIT
jgi:acyl-CoA thioesterase